jgi:hypothetical protein
MTLDIKGGLKNTSISHNRYVVFEELLSNAIDSYLIRRSVDLNAPPLHIELGVEFFRNSLISNTHDITIWCEDNGAGFGDEQIKAFVTKDSTYKDYLQIQGIGKCKGAGRIQFFHFFSQLEIDSVYNSGNERWRRKLSVNSEAREIAEQNFAKEPTSETVKTRLILKRLNEKALGALFDITTIRSDFTAFTIQHFLKTAFLQRFIVLKNIVGEFSITIIERENGESVYEVIGSDQLPTPSQVIPISVSCGHRDDSRSYKLKLTRYSLLEKDSPSLEHEIALCANSAIVTSLTKYFLKSAPDRRRPIDGKIELLLVEGEVLDQKVNVQRDGFNIPKECTNVREFSDDISLEDIVESLEETVFGILTPSDFNRDELLTSTQNRFGISRAMLDSVNIKIHYGDTEENIAKRVLKKFQDEIVRDTSNIVDMKQALLKLDPRSSDFRDVVNNLSWRYTSGLQKMDMANLSQLVVRRTAMLEVLQRATELMLSCQEDEAGKRQEHEKIIHNIFFPTGKDSTDSVDHDIWILNEEYHYYEHIASDKALSSIKWDGKNLFEADIDESLEVLFKRNNKEHRLKRPDIAIFNKEGAAIIIEFKAPGVELQDHINDLAQYARLLAAKSDGRIKRFFGYLVGDTMDESRMPTGWIKFPSIDGYFNTGRLDDPRTGRQYGELYQELVFYQHFVARAKNRLEVYQRRLNVNF